MTLRELCDRFDARVNDISFAVVAGAFLVLLVLWELAARRSR